MLLNRKTYLVRKNSNWFSYSYDIISPETQSQLGMVKERTGVIVKIFRFFISQQILPTKFNIYESSNPKDKTKLIFSLQPGLTLFKHKVKIRNHNGKIIGWIKNKAFSVRGEFHLFDGLGNEVAWAKWNRDRKIFQLVDSSKNEIGTVTKNKIDSEYIISLNGKSNPVQTILSLSAGLAVDIIYNKL